jgi:curved DNA-binding protein CbpA
MKTLYDLLEALPDDDADGLRAAFRKAAKANHPDFNPGNAEASERFRRIVRANAILSDGQQRAAYDRLLEIAPAAKPAAQGRLPLQDDPSIGR